MARYAFVSNPSSNQCHLLSMMDNTLASLRLAWTFLLV